MNKTVSIIIGIVVVLALMGGSFYGGMAYQTYRNNQTRAAFLAGRGFNGTGGTGGNGGTGGAGGTGAGGFGGTVTGQVKSLNGNTLQLSTARNVTTVNFDSSTRIEKADSTTVSSLQPGDRVIIMGQRDTTSGAMTASQVLIISTP